MGRQGPDRGHRQAADRGDGRGDHLAPALGVVLGPRLANIAILSLEQDPLRMAVRASRFMRTRQPRLKAAAMASGASETNGPPRICYGRRCEHSRTSTARRQLTAW